MTGGPAPDRPGERLLDLVAVMDRLRSPGGCPWDAEQTHRSLVRHLVEETYEAIEAIEAGDRDELREELGDVLLQVVFHARIAAEHETDPWTIDDVAAEVVDKLVRRHPHVFGDGDARTADEVRDRWETLKRREKQRESVVDGIPLAQPALSYAAAVARRAGRAGIDVATPRVPAADAEEAAQLGDALLALAIRANELDVDPEQALREANRRYADAVRAAQRRTASS